LFGVVFDPEDEGDMLLRNIKFSPNNMALTSQKIVPLIFQQDNYGIFCTEGGVAVVVSYVWVIYEGVIWLVVYKESVLKNKLWYIYKCWRHAVA
jgi:hypothetical protein